MVEGASSVLGAAQRKVANSNPKQDGSQLKSES